MVVSGLLVYPLPALHFYHYFREFLLIKILSWKTVSPGTWALPCLLFQGLGFCCLVIMIYRLELGEILQCLLGLQTPLTMFSRVITQIPWLSWNKTGNWVTILSLQWLWPISLCAHGFTVPCLHWHAAGNTAPPGSVYIDSEEDPNLVFHIQGSSWGRWR